MGITLLDIGTSLPDGRSRQESRQAGLDGRKGAAAAGGDQSSAGQPWAARPLGERLSWCRQFRRAIAREADALSALVSEEIGKPEIEALMGDVAPLLAACRWHERHAARVLRPKRVRGTPLWQAGLSARAERVPLGRVGIVATWNYPLQLLGVQMVQALVAGNEVVIKPSERSPRSHERLLDLAAAAGLPEGALVRYPASRDAGPRMLREEHLDHVVFTGSTVVGREIAAVCAERLIPTTLELSGLDSAFVLADADPSLAARSIWMGITMNAGQTCIAPHRVLVDRSVYIPFLAALAPLAAGAPPVRLISEAAAQRAFTLAAEAVRLGGRSLSGVLEPPAGAMMRPLAIVDCAAGSPIVHADYFAPVLSVLPVDSQDHALAIHRVGDHHLSASVFSRSANAARKLGRELGVTTVTINDCVLPAAHPGAPIGGRRRAGWGASRGEEGLLAMSRPLLITRTPRFPRPPTDPPTPSRARAMARFLRWWYSR